MLQIRVDKTFSLQIDKFKCVNYKINKINNTSHHIFFVMRLFCFACRNSHLPHRDMHFSFNIPRNNNSPRLAK